MRRREKRKSGMTDALNGSRFLIREHAGLLKAAHELDVLSPDTAEPFLQCREETVGRLSKVLRFCNYWSLTPFDVQIRTPDGRSLLRIVRGVPVFASRVHVYDGNNDLVGGFAQKLISFSGSLDVQDAQGETVCHLRGGLTRKVFRFVALDGVELARVSRQWSGFSKELYKRAGDYLLQIDDAVPTNSTIRQLILASGLCVNLVLRIEVP
jgi:hypothetical protein